MIAVEFAIRGSADQDPPGKPGVANMATSLLDEGAGPYDAAAFHDRLERKAIELSFRAGRDYLRGTLRTSRTTRTRRSTICASRSPSRASIPPTSSACARS